MHQVQPNRHNPAIQPGLVAPAPQRQRQPTPPAPQPAPQDRGVDGPRGGSAPPTVGFDNPPPCLSPPQLYTTEDNRIVTADGEPYLGLDLEFDEANQTISDHTNLQSIDLEDLERQNGICPPKLTSL